jgi:hypothetical protein
VTPVVVRRARGPGREEGAAGGAAIPVRSTFPVVVGAYLAPGLPGGRDAPRIAVMTGCVFPAPLRDASPPEVPGPRERREKKALAISLDEFVADRYDEGMQYKRLGIVSETLAFLS